MKSASNHNRATLRIFWQHTRNYATAFWAVIFTVIGANALNAYRPFLYKRFFDILPTARADAYPDLLRVVLLVFALNLGVWACWRIATFVSCFLTARVMSDLLNSCFKYLHGHSYTFFADSFSGSLVRRVNRYTRSYEDVTDRIYWNILPALTGLSLSLWAIFTRMPGVAVAVLIWMVVYLVIDIGFALNKFKIDAKLTAADTAMTGHLADTISNNLNLKLFGSLLPEFKAFHTLTEKVFVLQKRTWMYNSWAQLVEGFLTTLLELGLLLMALRYWREGRLSVGDFVFLQAYLIVITNYLWGVGRDIYRFYENLADAGEMTGILEQPHEVQDLPGAAVLTVESGAISFKNVDFSYEGSKKVLQDFSLDIKAGDRVAFIGPSGGGKSTIVKLLLRFLDIQAGQILIDGQNIADVTQNSLREHISLVPQEPLLFHRSLLDNIRYAKPDATQEEVIAAAKAAHCHEFIEGLANGYDTLVGERGTRLSGGERQRIAIARAILKNPRILILDEATASVDSETEKEIQKALDNLVAGRTTIAIAHRLSTLQRANRLVVMDRGKVVEEGPHEELMAKEGAYYRLYQAQARNVDTDMDDKANSREDD